MGFRRGCAGGIVLALGFLVLTGNAQDPVELGSRRELFVDRFLIENVDGLELRLQQPRRAGPALVLDRPWEGGFCGYVTVIHDRDRYRMYYRGLPGMRGAREVTCVAESEDGVHWRRPELGLFEAGGTRANNVVLVESPYTHNFTPFVDRRPGCPEGERYKALGGNARSGLVAFVSADGLRWRKLREAPVFVDKGWVFDSQNVAFWSTAEGRYVLYYRKCPDRVRAIARATSNDFIQWSKPVMMTYSDTGTRKPRHHLYTNATQPYFRAPHLYVALAQRFFPGKVTIEKKLAAELVTNPGYRVAASDAVFMTSRGGSRYDRVFLEGFLNPGPSPRDWIARNNMPACGIVPARDPRQMYLYRISHYAQPTMHISRFVLRVDGFASLHAGVPGGVLVTKRLRFRERSTERCELALNLATSAAGEVRVEVRDDEGKPVPGFTHSDCDPIVGDAIDRVVTWKGKSDLGRLAGETVTLRITMTDADLYSLRFR